MSNEVTIIQSVLNGEQEAFTNLVRQYQGVVFALTYHYVSDFQDAQEVAQNVFMKVYRRLNTLKEPNRFSSWLRRIVYTESMMFLRRHKKKFITHMLDAESPEMVLRDVKQYKYLQRRNSVMDALEELPDELRLLVEMRYLGGYNSKEIGKLLDMKSGTVRYRLHKAISLLKEEFQMVEEKLQSEQLTEDFAKDVLMSLGRLKGRVIGIDGKPMGNIQLHLDQLLPGKGGLFSSKGIQVDADGKFSMDIPNWRQYRSDEVDTGEFHIGLYGMVGGAVRHADTSVTLKIGEQAHDIVLDLREKSHQLRVRVVDLEGKPVENAMVAFHLRYPEHGGHGFGESYDGKDMRYFLTDKEGLTPMLHLSAFDYQFEVTAENFKKPGLSEWKRIKIPEEIPEDGVLEIQLEPGGRISGRIVNSEGMPVANAKIVIRYYKSDKKSWRVGRYINLSYTAVTDVFTDDKGRFAFTTLENIGSYTLHAYHKEHGVDCLLDVPVGIQDAVFHLMPVVSLVGKIIKDSKPVVILEEDYVAALGNVISIDFVESKGKYAKFNDKRIQPYSSCKIPTFTDKSGVFRIDYLFPGATYRLTIPCEGKEYERTVTLGEDAETHVTFELD